MDMQEQSRHSLNDTQAYILGIMREVAGIFDELNIPWFMQGGTMLGAVRHKGFIPWDDDIDIGVYRQDYRRLLDQIADKLPEHLALRTYWDESDHHYYFARIVDTRYRIKRMGSMEVRYENVWIDIFPLDGMPDGALARAWHKVRLLTHRVKYHIGCLEKVNVKRPGRALVERVIIAVANALQMHRWFDSRKELDILDGLLTKYPVEKSDYVVNFMGQTSYRFNELFKKEVYGTAVMYPFEDMRMPGPEKYDEYLTSLYGNYMEPPREADRNAHVSMLVKNENTNGDE